MGPPYEPLSQAELKHLTHKCAFLLALASGRRRSDVHAFSMSPACLRWSRNHSSVTIHTDPSFIAKNQIRHYVPEPVVIPSLSSVVGHADRERLLCPVRALRFYLDKTKGGRGSRTRLFLPIKAGREDISAESISRWIVKVVKTAYDTASEQSKSLFRIKAHEVRALASSFALAHGIAFESIMSAAFWHGQNTFADFYLRTLANHSDQLYSLGPIVAAQNIIRPQVSQHH